MFIKLPSNIKFMGEDNQVGKGRGEIGYRKEGSGETISLLPLTLVAS